ncbi:MAG TPA: site-2 protease family protein [Acidimicrobiales bacterium]|nr:site-2 protease family protein [Acidimicrobiales bacterium]
MPSSGQIEVASFGIFIVSVILHEISHGAVALLRGDDTAKRAGRLTLNPIAHLDPIGSVLVPGVLLLSHTGVVFGWARPVPVNVSRMRSPRNDAVLTALAGPATNVVLVVVSLVVIRAVHPEVNGWACLLLIYAGLINLWLGIFNMLPVPPLDGSSLVERLVPDRRWREYLVLRQYSMPAVFLLVIIGYESGATSHAFNWLYVHWVQLAGYHVA